MKKMAAYIILLAATPALAHEAQPSRQATPEAFSRAVACRAITNPEERLACYDREVAAMAAAEAANEIRVVDRQQVQNTRRTLFGLTLPDLNIFGGDTEDPMNEINGTIRTASELPDGKWAFTLEDGARWVQIDGRDLSSYPRAGQTVRIRRAAMGSFLANIGRNVAIRVRRTN